MIKAVLFDMDGVIIDTEPLHRKAYFKMFEEVGIQVSEALYTSFTGMATFPICERLCKEYELNHEPKELVRMKRVHFKELFQTDTSLQLIPGVLSLIQEYVANGLTLVVASSASMENINRVFDRFDLNQYFKAKVSGADLKQSKPHPEIFEKAAMLAETAKESCMVIEDATNGIKAAKAAGIYCVAYRSKHSTSQDYSLADKVIDSYEEIAFARL
ncbi:HAD family phosphatase [Aureisphaera galaxeae]|uniref:HAD family hydrolase n=1 Tax=Aureisphaera galaxeae TaxID=1538023 RepID=UPI00234FC944|nr:HAD family phosphatase [Aureisphaera galaxeae]MDC8003111.1 HAD family phosphatase [Aureisphaera galaxeae]